jgi:nucleoside phosphorylase
MQQKEKINMTLLGRKKCNVDIVIITPIHSAFIKFCDRLSAEDVKMNCFFENALFYQKNSKRGMVVFIPQGMSAQDVMFGFENVHVFFYGYAGGLEKNIEVGNIFEIARVCKSSEEYDLLSMGWYKTVKGGYSPCMLGNVADRYQKRALLDNCNIVEMEIAGCAQAAKENNNLLSAFVVISDIPGKTNFWDLNDYEKKQFNMKKNELIDTLTERVEYI